ncbi:hypothetical protein H7170_02730 [Candidatus Gracilibacteria bacterium]|nr:hypothetical protein [Candidatus Gracilibacteria bacterium]
MDISDLISPTLVAKEKPSRKAQQREARRAKMIEKAKRKVKVAKKAERKLVVKAERVKANKRENSKRKLVKKIQAREEAGTLKQSDTPVSKPEKKVFVKDNFGIPQKK